MYFMSCPCLVSLVFVLVPHEGVTRFLFKIKMLSPLRKQGFMN